MEIPAAKEHKFVVFFYEAIGTGLLLYAINLQNGELFGNFGISFMLFSLILIGGPMTGAHYNPAVTVGVYISNKNWSGQFLMFVIMIAGQIIGGLFGVMLVWASLFNEDGQVGVTRSRGGVPTTEILLLLPNEPNVSQFNCFIIEIITTFTFVLINLLVKNGKTSPSSDGFLSGLAVSFALLAMICISGKKSGACLNPAVAIAQTVFEVTQYGNQIPGD